MTQMTSVSVPQSTDEPQAALTTYEAPTLIPLGSLRSQTQAIFFGVGADAGIYS